MFWKALDSSRRKVKTAYNGGKYFHLYYRSILVVTFLFYYRGFMRETTSTPEQISNQVQSLEKELTEMKRKENDLDKCVLRDTSPEMFKILTFLLLDTDIVDCWNLIYIACKQTPNLHTTLT